MAALLSFGLAILVCQANSQCIPRLPLAQPQPVVNPPVVTTPVVASTIIDNSVSNALANAIQLLIVSNLIENTMNCPKNNPCYSNPVVEIAQPEILTPIISYCDPIPRPCDISFISPYDKVDLLPNLCYPDVVPIMSNFASPSYIGCDCQNYLPNIGYDCQNCLSNCDCQSVLSNIGCDFPNYSSGCDVLSPCSVGNMYPCDQYGPVAAEMLFPQSIPAQINCNFGCLPNVPCINMNVDPWVSYADPCSCGGMHYGNSYFY